jgi:lipopolysaccharide biosynthesis glycosyltransferase
MWQPSLQDFDGAKKYSSVAVFACDQEYVDSAVQAIAALHYKGRWQGDIVLLTDDVSREDIEWFRTRGVSVLSCAPITNHGKFFNDPVPALTRATLLRFYCFTDFFRQWERVLYLDTDILIRGPIDRVLNAQKKFAAVRAQFPTTVRDVFLPTISHEEKASLSQQFDLDAPTFNAGVFSLQPLLFSRDAFPKLVELYKKFGPLTKMGDQSIISAYFGSDWEELPSLLNLQMNSTAVPARFASAFVIHFCGTLKPWHAGHPLFPEWMRMRERADGMDVSHPLARTSPLLLLVSTFIFTVRSHLQMRFVLLCVHLLKFVNSFLRYVRHRYVPNVANAVEKKICDIPRRFRMKFRVLRSREEFPYLLRALRLHGEGVEVGVYLGEFSEVLLRDSPLSVVHSVDPWKAFDRAEYRDKLNASVDEQEDRYQRTRERLQQFGERSVILRSFSAEASEQFRDNSLDFVFIDANHDFEHCSEDLRLWWPEIREGGVMAGHDFFDAVRGGGVYGVKTAVHTFFGTQGVRVRSTWESCPSWFVRK